MHQQHCDVMCYVLLCVMHHEDGSGRRRLAGTRGAGVRQPHPPGCSCRRRSCQLYKWLVGGGWPGGGQAVVMGARVPLPPAVPLACARPSSSAQHLVRSSTAFSPGFGSHARLDEHVRRCMLLACGLHAGAVYYIGNVHVRPAQQMGVVRRLLVNNVFRALLLLSHADVEQWQLPYDQVVELGLVMFV